jgi:hypothetical protein
VLAEWVLPAELELDIQRIEQGERSLMIRIGGAKNTAGCPECGPESDRLHSS